MPLLTATARTLPATYPHATVATVAGVSRVVQAATVPPLQRGDTTVSRLHCAAPTLATAPLGPLGPLQQQAPLGPLQQQAQRNASTTSTSNTDHTRKRIVIAGAGSGGLAVASQLVRSGAARPENITVIDPATTHYYKPLWTFVGGGLAPFADSAKPLDEAVRDAGAGNFVRAAVTRVDAAANKVHLAGATGNQREIDYDVLVLAPGIQVNWDKIPGLSEALRREEIPVVSNFSPVFVNKTFRHFQKFLGGTAVFTQPNTPIQCAGAPQKIAYIFEEYLRTRSPHTAKNVRENTKVVFEQGMGKLFAIDTYGQELTALCKRRNIQVNLLHNLVSVDPDSRSAVFSRPKKEKTSELEEFEQPFDLLHATPPMGPPAFVAESGLGDTAGWVNVNKQTTQHVEHPNIFALGDASSLPTSRTAAAAAAQSFAVSENIASLLAGRQLTAQYSGYTSCPLITGKGSLILAEFNGYTGETKESLPFDQSKESRIAYDLTRYVIPQIYWRGQLRGRWHGPEPYQGFTSLGFKGTAPLLRHA